MNWAKSENTTSARSFALGRVSIWLQSSTECRSNCRWVGQFKPSTAANPVIGESGELEFVKEDRVELVVHDNGEKEELRKAIAELKKVHPYEEVAYDVYRVEDV